MTPTKKPPQMIQPLQSVRSGGGKPQGGHNGFLSVFTAADESRAWSIVMAGSNDVNSGFLNSTGRSSNFKNPRAGWTCAIRVIPCIRPQNGYVHNLMSIRILAAIIILLAPSLSAAQTSPDFSSDEFTTRRTRVMDAIGNQAIALIQGAPDVEGF